MGVPCCPQRLSQVPILTSVPHPRSPHPDSATPSTLGSIPVQAGRCSHGLDAEPALVLQTRRSYHENFQPRANTVSKQVPGTPHPASTAILLDLFCFPIFCC